MIWLFNQNNKTSYQNNKTSYQDKKRSYQNKKKKTQDFPYISKYLRDLLRKITYGHKVYSLRYPTTLQFPATHTATHTAPRPAICTATHTATHTTTHTATHTATHTTTHTTWAISRDAVGVGHRAGKEILKSHCLVNVLVN